MNKFFTLALASLATAGLQAAPVKTPSAVRFTNKSAANNAVAIRKAAREATAAKAMRTNVAKYLPGKVLTSIWDEDMQEWLPVSETNYTYNAIGNPITETEKDLESEEGSLLRITYSYDDLGRVVLQLSEVSVDDGQEWTPSEKRVNEYDSVVTDFKTLLEIFGWSDAWSLMTGNRYLIDRDGQGVLTQIQRQVMYQDAYDTTAKVENGVKDGAVVSSKVSELVSDGANLSWTTDIDLRDIVWHNTDGQPMAFEVEEYSRGANRVASAKSYYDDEYEGEVTGTYKNDLEGTFKFDFIDDSRLEIVTEYTDEATGSFRETYIVEYPEEDMDSGETYMYHEKQITEITYDEHGNTVKEYSSFEYDGVQEYAGGVLIDYEYDSNGTVVLQTESTYEIYEGDNGEMQTDVLPQLRMAMSDFVSAGSGVANVAADTAIRVSGKGISVATDGTATVEVYSLDGTRVASATLRGSGSLSLAQLPAGVYIAKVASADASKTVKLKL